MNRIVPALLTDKREDFKRMVEACAKFTDYIQIDIMDGEFVSSRSINKQDLSEVTIPIGNEAHLMVNDPCSWIEVFKNHGADRIIFHYEINKDYLEVIKKIKKAGLSAGIAVNPSTKIEDFKFLVKEVEVVLFMSVIPGFYGASFNQEVLDKIKQFKIEYPSKCAGIDGGIKFSNLKEVKASGVDYICVGSAILQNDNPPQAYREFMSLIGR